MKNSIYLSLLLLILAFAACKGPQNPEFKRIEDVNILSMDAKEIVLTANALIYNPNKMGVQLEHIDLDVALDGNTAGKVEQTNNVKIPAKSDIKIPLKATIDARKISKNLLSTALSFLQNQKLKVHYKGDITVKIAKINVKIPIDDFAEVEMKLN